MRRPLFILSALALLGSFLASAAVIHQHRVRTFGTVSGLPDPRLDPRPYSILAVNAALETYADLDPVFDSLARFHWLRQTFPWDEIEPAPGEYDWETWDQIVGQTAARKKGMIAVLNFSPAWARPSISPGSASDADTRRTGPPASPSAFGNFASLFARRYADGIDVYQIWDEPNISLGWGGQPPSAASYAALLQAAYDAIHAADPTATVVAAALAPTLEAGPDNISDLLYLQQLYNLGAGASFDAAAGKPYGFYTGPQDRLADPAVLNFSRFTLLRQVMVENGDAHKLLWGGNFGWNLQASPWGQAAAEEQVQYTLDAYDRAMDEWPWAGALALESYQPNAPPDDPRWGFALADPSRRPGELLPAIQAYYSSSISDFIAFPGNYGARHPAARYAGAWEFSDLGADIPESFSGARVEISFKGTDLALTVRRGDYRAYLYVEIDGKPANLLPRDERGAYLVLTAPQLAPQLTTIPVASGLAPDQTHTAVIRPERGWDQWAFAGFSVGRRVSDGAYALWLGLLTAMAALSTAGVWHWGRALDWGALGGKAQAQWERLGATGQLLLTALVGGLLYLTSGLTWGDELNAVSRRFGDALPVMVTALTAGLFYFSPSFLLAVVSLLALFALYYLRLDLALAFAALFIPFYLHPRILWQRGFSLVEVTTLLALAAWLLRNSSPIVVALHSRVHSAPQASNVTQHAARRTYHLPRITLRVSRLLSSVDWAVLAFLIVATLSLFTAELKGVAVREYRLVILEPAIFYFLVRRTPTDRAALWRIVDFFLLGAVVVAVIGLYQYATGTNLITAEGGVSRLRSVYGSPNNVGLYLGRALPIAAALAIVGRHSRRRILYSLAALVLGITILLTFSKGALFLGVPVALAVVLICGLGGRGLLLVGASAAAGLAALPIVTRLARFADLLNFGRGTSFFRTRLWISAWRMVLDYPWLGVGLDNFLYQYRSRYILPEAWEEPNLSHPHNIALDYLSRLGLLGFACGLWLQIAFWRVAIDAYRRLRERSPGQRGDLLALCIGLMASVADMLAHGLVDNSFFLPDLAFAFCLTLALVQHVQKAAVVSETTLQEPRPAV